MRRCAFLLLGIAVAALDAAQQRCLPLERHGIRRNVTLKIVEQAWTSHRLIRDALTIVLREAAGFEVTFVPCNSTAEASMAVESGTADLDPEAWGYDFSTRSYKDLVESAGEVGYRGRSGLYVFRHTLFKPGMAYADWYKFFDPSNIQALAGFLTLGEVNLTGLDHCPHGYCSTNSTYVPPACEADPASCPVILAPTALWDTGEWESRIRTHNLSLAVAFLGWDWQLVLLQYFYAGRDVVFYEWEPTEIVSFSELVKRVTFPPYVETCNDYTRKGTNSLFLMPCDYREFKLFKVANARLRTRAAEAFSVIRQFSIPRDELDGMLRRSISGIHKLNNSWNVSCEWLLSKPSDWWDKLVPACVHSPKDPPLRGDLFFNEDSLQCELRLGQEDCAAGMVYVQALNACLCTTGYFASGTSCLRCPAGTIASSPGQKECADCPVGTYTGAQGSSMCMPCSVGRFAAARGAAACQPCGSGGPFWTTMRLLQGSGQWVVQDGAQSAAACTCSDGYRQQGSECVPCGEGLLCTGMGAVEIAPGYSSDATLSVFTCFTDSAACPGGLPGQSCAQGRIGVTCSECTARMLPSDGACKPCEAGSRLMSIGLVSLLVLLLGTAYWRLVNTPRLVQSHGLLMLVSASGLLVAFVQQGAVLGALDVGWKEPLVALFHALNWLKLDISFFRFGCLGTLSSLSRFLIQLGLIIGFPAVLVSAHGALACACRRIPFDGPSVANATGTMVMVIYIAIVSAFVGPLQCMVHPNGRWTCRSYPSVVCWEEGVHAIMVSASVAALLVPLAFLAISVRAVVKLPAMVRACDTDFLRLYNFLFIRFRPERHWYAVVPLIRSLLMALTPILPNTFMQIISLQIVMLFCVVVTVHARPMRVPLANWMDTGLTSAMLLLASWSGFCMREDASHVVAWLIVVQAAAVVLIVLAVVFVVLVRRYGRLEKPFRYFLCHHKAGAAATARLLKMTLSGEIFLDSDNLSDLDTLFDVVANQVSTLLVLGSKDIFLRPWCVGEMTTARTNKVRMVLLELPDYNPPDGNFLCNYEQVVGSISCLAAHGIGVKMIRETLTWVSSVVPHVIVEVVSPPELRKLQPQLRYAGSTESNTSEKSDDVDEELEINLPAGAASSRQASRYSVAPKGMGKGGFVILVEDGDYEAEAIAHVLQQLTVSSAKEMPMVLLSANAGDPSTKLNRVVALATANCFHCANYLGALVVAWQQGAQVLPVVVDVNFRIPQKCAISPELAAAAANAVSSVADLRRQEITSEFLEELVESIFKEIAPSFHSHDPFKVLQAQAQEVAKRVKNAHALRTAVRNTMAARNSAVPHRTATDRRSTAVGLRPTTTSHWPRFTVAPPPRTSEAPPRASEAPPRASEAPPRASAAASATERKVATLAVEDDEEDEESSSGSTDVPAFQL